MWTSNSVNVGNLQPNFPLEMNSQVCIFYSTFNKTNIYYSPSFRRGNVFSSKQMRNNCLLKKQTEITKSSLCKYSTPRVLNFQISLKGINLRVDLNLKLLCVGKSIRLDTSANPSLSSKTRVIENFWQV